MIFNQSLIPAFLSIVTASVDNDVEFNPWSDLNFLYASSYYCSLPLVRPSRSLLDSFTLFKIANLLLRYPSVILSSIYLYTIASVYPSYYEYLLAILFNINEGEPFLAEAFKVSLPNIYLSVNFISFKFYNLLYDLANLTIYFAALTNYLPYLTTSSLLTDLKYDLPI